jgi:hypothetical protein
MGLLPVQANFIGKKAGHRFQRIVVVEYRQAIVCAAFFEKAPERGPDGEFLIQPVLYPRPQNLQDTPLWQCASCLPPEERQDDGDTGLGNCLPPYLQTRDLA